MVPNIRELLGYFIGKAGRSFVLGREYPAVGIPCGGSNASRQPRIRLLQVFAARSHRCNESEGLANSRKHRLWFRTRAGGCAMRSAAVFAPRHLAFAFLSILIIHPVWAQSNRGSIAGSILDSSGSCCECRCQREKRGHRHGLQYNFYRDWRIPYF